MYSVSDEFKKRLKQSHTAVSRVDVYNGDDLLVEGLQIERGYVHADAAAANRRRCDVVIGDPNLTPDQAADLLHPLSGNELHIYRGIRLHEGTSRLRYKDEVLSHDPVGYWRLGEKEGNVAKDASGNGVDGTYEGTKTFGQPGAIVGDHNTATAIDNLIALGTNPKSVPGEGTVECWVETSAWTDGSANGIYQNCVTWGNSANKVSIFKYGSTGLSTFYYRVMTPTGAIQDISFTWTTHFARSGYHHLVAIWDATHMRLYVNGVQVASKAITPPNAFPEDNTHIGEGHDRNSGGHTLDEFAIYDRALTADEIKEHYEAGLQKEQHTDELVPQGVFGIEDCNVDDQGESISISVKGFDRSKRVQRARWTDLFFVAEGTNVATAIRGILEDRYPGIVIDWVDTEVTTETTPPLVYGYGGWSGGGDPWEHASKLAESIGHELYFGVEGSCLLTPVPDPANDPVVWTYQEGPDNLLLFGSRQLTREEVFNHVIAFGLNTATDTPIRVEAMDTNPDSPTYVYGPFGDVPTYYRSTLLLTDTQAQAAAEALLRQKLGTPEQVRFISIVNPAHQLGDVVQIERERAGITGNHVIDKLAIPLGAMESMNATCRERRV